MDRLEAMTILLAAADTGSLSAASRHLRIPLATVSRRVSELETHLNVRLLHRGNRKLVLTDAGRGYAASCRRVIEDIAEIERTASGEYHAPQGDLFISVPVVLGSAHVLPISVEFLRAFPEIRLRVQQTERVVSMLEEHIDLAVRIGELPDSSLIAARVGLIRPVVCASPAYLKARGVPKKPSDLVSHDCIVNEGHATSYSWEFRIDGKIQTVQVSSRLIVNLGESAVVAAAAGGGIVRVLSYTVDSLLESRTLVTLLEEYEPASIPVNIIYPSQRQVPLKLRAFLDFATPRLRKRLGYKST
jgi:DNA-binding transcriptional LysR family regulator